MQSVQSSEEYSLSGMVGPRRACYECEKKNIDDWNSLGNIKKQLTHKIREIWYRMRH